MKKRGMAVRAAKTAKKHRASDGEDTQAPAHAAASAPPAAPADSFPKVGEGESDDEQQ